MNEPYGYRVPGVEDLFEVCHFSLDGTSVDVIVQLEKTPLSPQKPHPPPDSPTRKLKGVPAEKTGQSEGGRDADDDGNLQSGPPPLFPSAKRNLTQSFENASLATPTNSGIL